MLVPQGVADALLLPRDELVAQHGRFEPVGAELDAGSGRAPRALAPGAALALVDEAPFGEGTKVVAAGGGAVPDDRCAFGGRGLVDRVQVVEQGKASRDVRARASRAGRSG